MRGRTAATAWTVLLLSGLLTVPAGSTPAATEAPDAPVRILIVGDSMTQGSSGDWTWRYRLWKYLQASGAAADFVGPRDDLFDLVSDSFGSQAYVDPAFDQDHAARWGLSMAFPDVHQTIGDLVADYRPDVVVEMLGVNDLTWLQGTPQELVSATSAFVADARAVDPAVDFVLCRIPQPWYEQVDAFNQLLDGLADNLDSPASHVVSAQTDVDIVRATDTWDEHHPDARGEVKIAARVADSLAQLGVGDPAPRPLQLDQIPLGPRIPPVLTATPSPYGASLAWLRSPGANESEVWTRDLSSGGDWRLAAEHVSGTSYPMTGLPAWHRVQVQVAPIKGSWRAERDAWSNVVDVEVLGDHLDAPAARATATSAGVATVAWDPVPGATSYAVQARRADQPAAWLDVGMTTATSSTVPDLVNTVGYLFRVQARRGDLASAFSSEARATVPRLSAVRRVRAAATARGVRTTARPVRAATSYTLRIATAKRCGRPPRTARFAVAASGLTRTTKTLRVDARAVWVRWVAVRSGVEGEVARSSTACVRRHQ